MQKCARLPKKNFQNYFAVLESENKKYRGLNLITQNEMAAVWKQRTNLYFYMAFIFKFLDI